MKEKKEKKENRKWCNRTVASNMCNRNSIYVSGM